MAGAAIGSRCVNRDRREALSARSPVRIGGNHAQRKGLLTWRSILFVVSVLAALEATAAQASQEQPRYSADDVRAALEGASAQVRCIVTAEIGGHGLDPMVRGSAGERGPAQLHPRGLLADFYRQGFRHPEDPAEAVAYLEGALARGLGPHWTTWGRC